MAHKNKYFPNNDSSIDKKYFLHQKVSQNYII